jgi:acetyl esterase/lipase
MKRTLSITLCSLTILLTRSLLSQVTTDPPFQLPDNVVLKTDVVYGKGGDRDLKSDLFLPKKTSASRPAIVFIHGGGWSGGNRRAFYRQAAHFASAKGYLGMCIEYRLSGEAKFPAAVEDSKCAVRWLRANAADYQIDPNRIAACGGSAGGHLAAMLGVTDKSANLEGKGGHASFSSRVNLVIDFNGPSDLAPLVANERATTPVVQFLGATPEQNRELYRQASPITYVDKKAPPFLFLHGTADATVPIEQSRILLKKLRDAGVEAEIYEADGAGHGFFNRPPFYEPTLKRMQEFLDRHFGSRI